MLVGPLLTSAWCFFTRAKRLAAATLGEARAHDRRPPVLLLRSFQDDLTPLDRKLLFSTLQPSDHYSRAWTLDEAAEKILRAWGR